LRVLKAYQTLYFSSNVNNNAINEVIDNDANTHICNISINIHHMKMENIELTST